MRISIKVKTKSLENKVEKINDTNYIISVKKPPYKDKANKAVIEILSEYFKVPKCRISILVGNKSKQKIIEIKDIS